MRIFAGVGGFLTTNQSAWDLGEKIYFDELDLKRSKEQGRI